MTACCICGRAQGRSSSRTLFARGTDEDYHMITRGRLLDRVRVALAGSIAVKMVLGEETNFNVAGGSLLGC